MTGIRLPSRRWSARLRSWELATRPVHPDAQAAMDRRWNELPTAVRTPAQVLGRNAVGCEGTHGVFPRCNLACTPCYHSRDANQVAVNGEHTRREVAAQMSMLRRIRGPRAHAQLIGGEVSLLAPDDHAATLQIMRNHGREPMSMTHGDFDYPYLTALVLGPDGRRRLDRVSFAGHFDMFMFGRRGLPRPTDEAALNPYRRQFTQMFARLRREHGVRSFLAHNMTVTPGNLDQVAGVVADCHTYGFGLFSFQPAAFIGDDRRWHEGYRDTTADDVWAQIEKGAGTRLPFRALQHGDERCNRTTYGFYLGETYHPLLDDQNPADLLARDAFLEHLGGITFSATALPLLILKIVRAISKKPSCIMVFARWLVRMIRRTGIAALMQHRIRPVTFVLHSFMDATDVAPAWEAMQRGQDCTDPRLADTQQRLRACSYSMAHPRTGQLVPACVQHGVLDRDENRELRRLLPLTARTGSEERRRVVPGA